MPEKTTPRMVVAPAPGGPGRCSSSMPLAASLPWDALTGYDVDRLYALKGEIVASGVRAVTGLSMPVFTKRPTKVRRVLGSTRP